LSTERLKENSHMPTNTPVAAQAVAPSTRPGMGTMLFPGGVAFRVWAPFASSVGAAGTFNHWNPAAHPFASEGNGYWSVEVPGITTGHKMYQNQRFENVPGSVLSKLQTGRF
jgi:1,4-alpha-glucan branching enzyme